MVSSVDSLHSQAQLPMTYKMKERGYLKEIVGSKVRFNQSNAKLSKPHEYRMKTTVLIHVSRLEKGEPTSKS